MARVSINLKEGSLKQEEAPALIAGIDLGTTNSLVAYVKNGTPVMVRDSANRQALVPSILHFLADGSILVGDAARRKLVEDPAHTIYSVKRLMGKSYRDMASLQNRLGYEIIEDDTESLVKIRVHNRFYTPIELSAEILKELKKRVETETGFVVDKAVITVPAYFNDAQRQATRDAGKLAGLDVLRILNEPTAASLAYGLGQKEAQTIAVYDLGGGTFDISILHFEDGVFEVLATNGDTFLGGDDFDRAIVDFWLKNVYAEISASLYQEIRLLAEKAKKSLSIQEYFTGKAGQNTFSLSNTEYETLIAPLVQKSIECCRLALADSKLTKAKIDHVVLVGGSTRTPLVKQAVENFFEKKPFDQIDPDEVVALGAAIQADVLAGNQKDVLLLDITPLSLGIETMGGLMDVIVPRNTKVPSKTGRQYTTSVDGQRNLKIAVYQGERDLVAHNRMLGEFILRNIPPMPAGLPKIEVQFILNADGILKVKAKELRSGTEQAVEIKPTYGITEEEMGRMLLESIQNAGADMMQRALLEARNEASHILLSAQKFVRQNEAILDEAEIFTTKALADALQTTVYGTDKDLINKAIQALNDYTAPLAHRAMDHTILQAMQGKKI